MKPALDETTLEKAIDLALAQGLEPGTFVEGFKAALAYLANAPISDEMVERGAKAMFHAEAWSTFWALDDAKALARACLTAAQLPALSPEMRRLFQHVIDEHENLAGEPSQPMDPECGDCNEGNGPHKMRCPYHFAVAAMKGEG